MAHNKPVKIVLYLTEHEGCLVVHQEASGAIHINEQRVHLTQKQNVVISVRTITKTATEKKQLRAFFKS